MDTVGGYTGVAVGGGMGYIRGGKYITVWGTSGGKVYNVGIWGKAGVSGGGYEGESLGGDMGDVPL